MRRLLIRPGAIGDILTSLPALESLRGETTEIWTSEAVLPLLRHLGEVHSIASTGLNLLELGLAPAAVSTRLARFDSIVSWYGGSRPEFRQAVRPLPFAFLPALPDGSRHAVEFYNSQARALGAFPARVPRLPFTCRPGGYAVVHPFSGSPSKNWPLESFREAAAWLGRIMPVHWCAGPEEPLTGAVRFDDLGRLAEWLAAARIYVGNDSGITHLAAAVGVPVVAIFQASDPFVWAPGGARVLECPSVEKVIAALRAETGGSQDAAQAPVIAR